jgi:hypothetical protein
VEGVAAVAHDLVHLRAVRTEADEQESRPHPRFNRMDPGRAVGSKGRVEADLSVEPFASEATELRIGELELGPCGHRGLP